jgi:hypothetical protein
MQTYQLGKGTVLGILAGNGVKMRGQGILASWLGMASRCAGKASLKTDSMKPFSFTEAAGHLSGSPLTSAAAPKLCGRLCLRRECHCEGSGNAAHCEPRDLEATGNGRSANQGRTECPGPARSSWRSDQYPV